MNTATGMLCPTCRVGLVMSERQGVEIDYCPQCRGVWLDRGELDKIIERSATEAPRAQMAQEPGPDPRGFRQNRRRDNDDDDDDNWGGGGRRGGFLSDFFDF